MGVVELFILIGLCAAVAVFLMWATTSHTHVINFDPTQLDMEAVRDGDIQALLDDGNKSAAIKTYHDLAGVSLQDARNAIEFLITNPRFIQQDKPKRLERSTPFDTGVRELLRSGNKPDAIKIYREFTGASLTDANEEIERIEWEEKQHYRQNGH